MMSPTNCCWWLGWQDLDLGFLPIKLDHIHGTLPSNLDATAVESSPVHSTTQPSQKPSPPLLYKQEKRFGHSLDVNIFFWIFHSCFHLSAQHFHISFMYYFLFFWLYFVVFCVCGTWCAGDWWLVLSYHDSLLLSNHVVIVFLGQWINFKPNQGGPGPGPVQLYSSTED